MCISQVSSNTAYKPSWHFDAVAFCFEKCGEVFPQGPDDMSYVPVMSVEVVVLVTFKAQGRFLSYHILK